MHSKIFINFSLSFLTIMLWNESLAGTPESMEKNAVIEEVTVIGVRNSSPGRSLNTLAGSSLSGSRSYSPSQSEGQDAKSATEYKRECKKQKNLEIDSDFDDCVAEANTYKSNEYHHCPIEDSIETELNTGIGRINVKTSPRKTCTDNADVAFESKISTCNANASTKRTRIAAECR
jgi:hypothetical protein